MHQPSDDELYRQLRNGQPAALAQLYQRYEPALFRYALHMAGNRSAAEEVAHDVFMQLIEPRNGFRPELGSFQAYLYGIARNRLRMLQRVPAAQPLTDYPGPANTLGALIHAESLAALHHALQALPENYRAVVVLCDLEEKSYEEAALLLACPIGTVRSRLHRARLLLAARLQPAAREVAR